MNDNAPLWTIAIALYAMLVALIIGLWRFDFTISRVMAMLACFYVGCGFGVFAGYILAHVFRRGAM